MKIQGVMLHEYGVQPELDSVDLLDPQSGEVAIRIVAASVCASDGHAIHNETPIDAVPSILGHEGGGVVERIGPGVKSLSVGDHVVIGPYGPCGSCYNCRTGLASLCDSPTRLQNARGVMEDGHTRVRQHGVEVYTFAGVGALAEYAVVHEAKAIQVDPDLPLDVLCMAGCAITTGLGAVFNIASVQPGDAVAIVGCGGVGLSVIQGCRIAGATTIIAIDQVAAKLALAQELGASHTIDSSTQSLSGAVREIVPRGLDTAFEVVGIPELVGACLELTRIGGTCVMVGAPPTGSVIPVRREDLMAQRRLVGCRGGGGIPARDIPRIVALYNDGRLNLDLLVGQRLPPSDFGLAFDNLTAGIHARSVIQFSDA